jgi:hypothetical protein
VSRELFLDIRFSNRVETADNKNATIAGVKVMIRYSLLVPLIWIVFSATVRAQHTTCNLDSVLRVVETAYAGVRDYRCALSKKEYVDGEYIVWKNVVYKFRKPNFYYMKWTEGKTEGQEVLYAGEKYDNKLKVHLGGLLNVMNLSLDPKGSMAMRSGRHPITESDHGFTIRQIRMNVQRAQREKAARIDCLNDATVGNRRTKLYRAEFPENKGFINHVIFMHVDNELNLPVKIEMYDWSDRLVESYTFSNLRINTGLKDIDFDTENPAYRF